jgi:polyferredoxin
MDKMHYPRGLIRYDTQHAIEHKSTKILRPRIILYGALLLALTAAFFIALAMRKPLGMDVIRDRNQLYRVVGEQIENVYTVKILNKSETARRFRIGVNEPERLQRCV